MNHRDAAGGQRHAIRVAALVDRGVAPLRRRYPLFALPLALTVVNAIQMLALVTDEDGSRRTASQGDNGRGVQAGIWIGRCAVRNAHRLRGLAVQPSIRMEPVGDAELLERSREPSGSVGAHEEEALLAARHPEVSALVHRDVPDVLRPAVLRTIEVPVGGGRENDVLERRPAIGRTAIGRASIGRATVRSCVRRASIWRFTGSAIGRTCVGAVALSWRGAGIYASDDLLRVVFASTTAASNPDGDHGNHQRQANPLPVRAHACPPAPVLSRGRASERAAAEARR